MKAFTASKNDGGVRLDRFAAKNAPFLPKSLMYKYIRLKRIKINGKRCREDSRLKEGDLVEMYIGDEFFADSKKKEERFDFLKAPSKLEIVYEDANILIADKKPGVLSHPCDGEYIDTLITRIQRYLYEKGEYDPDAENAFAPALANRIDRNTGGIVIAAKNADALRILNEKIKNREIEKSYLCILVGCPEKRSGIMSGYMVKDEKKNEVKVSPRPVDGAKTMITEYRILGERNGLSLAEVKLHTGRTHQIRAHFAYIGCPLLGDGKYGSNEINKRYGGYKKQCLYSYKVAFTFKTDASALNYLKGKSFRVENVWFADAFYSDTL